MGFILGSESIYICYNTLFHWYLNSTYKCNGCSIMVLPNISQYLGLYISYSYNAGYIGYKYPL
jgi:hypothetical protein